MVVVQLLSAYYPAIPLLGLYLEKMKTQFERYMHTSVHCTTIYIAKTKKQPKFHQEVNGQRRLVYACMCIRYICICVCVCVCVRVCAQLLQSCLIICYPVNCSPPGSSVHGILQASILEWVTIHMICVCIYSKYMLHIFIMEYYSTIKKSEIMSFSPTYMDLEIIILSEVSQTENN